MAKPELNEEQKDAFKAIRKFLDHPAANTFVLKGYAGTGKTFLMQHLAGWLLEQEQDFCMLASTGRAATVLRGKTGIESKTVHSELYHFSKVDGDDDNIPEDAPIDKYGQMTLQFSLRPPDNKKCVYIVDEASMLSSEASGEFIAQFGSGLLLHDFFDALGNNKVIFVGDPCQLPPVGQNFSPALDLTWLAAQHRTAVTLTLEIIERVKSNNDILVLANRIREMSAWEEYPKFPRLPAANLDNVQLHDSYEALFQAYVDRYIKVGPSGALAIARTNRAVQALNTEFRKELYGESDVPLQVGDVLLVNRNNYKVPLTNGDFVTVTKIGELCTQVELNFVSITIKAHASDVEYELLLSLDILYGDTGQFSREQSKALMVNFSQRMKRDKHKTNAKKYKEEMMKDEYLNCLQATYGYAVTCHKSQGGEWNDVFLFLDSKMYGMPGAELCRWWYTSVTRAKRELNLERGWWIV